MINRENNIQHPGNIVAPFTGDNSEAKPKNGKTKTTVLSLLAISTILSGVGYLVWRQQTPAVVNNQIKISGRIEGYETEIGVNRSGRVEAIAVREGATVKQGQTLAQLDNSQDQILQSQLRSAEAQIASAQAEKAQAEAEVARIQFQIQQIDNQIAEAELNLQKSQGDSQGQIASAQSQVSVAKAQIQSTQAQVEEARARVELAQTELNRHQSLLEQGVISQQQLDNIQTELNTATAQLKTKQAEAQAAAEQLEVALGSLVQAQSAQFNPDIRQSQKQSLQQQKAQHQAQLQGAIAQVRVAEAKVKDAKTNKAQVLTQIAEAQKDLDVVSPLDGVVVARHVEPGMVVNNTSTILTIIDPETVYLRAFVAAGEVGKLRLGQKVQVWIDGAGDRPIEGELIAIDPQASFTPENIYFAKDRVRQVFGLRIQIKNPPGCFDAEQSETGANLPCARVGMPADATIDF